jgi:hypothetical protein
MNTNFYRTSDLPLAAVISLFMPVEGIDKTLPLKAFWYFERCDELDELVRCYYRKELQVEPSAYFERVSFLKSMLYSD